jgi:hypothetical protein
VLPWARIEPAAVPSYVRNRALSVAHVIVVPAESTDRELWDLVRGALDLRDVVTMLNGAVGMRFYYHVKNADEPIPFDKKLAELHITDGTTIDLEVQLESFGPAGPSPIITYRKGASTALAPPVTRSLLHSAFGHLIPW